MAGYNGYSKSNNAIAAEESGKMTATALAKVLGVSSRAIAACLRPSEWHHTSKNYNRTNYYAADELAALCGHASLASVLAASRTVSREAVADLKKLRRWDLANPVGDRVITANVSWTEWSGHGRRKSSTNHEHKGVRVTLRGAWAIVHLPSGDIKKKTGGNWFSMREVA